MSWNDLIGREFKGSSTREVRERYNAGVVQLSQGNTKSAIAAFESLVEENHISAIYNLAMLYAYGRGDILRLDKAIALLDKATELGHKEATIQRQMFLEYKYGLHEDESLVRMFIAAGPRCSDGLMIYALSRSLTLSLKDDATVDGYFLAEIQDIGCHNKKGNAFMKNNHYVPDAIWVGSDRYQDLQTSPGASCAVLMRETEDVMTQIMKLPAARATFIRCSVLALVGQSLKWGKGFPSIPSLDFYEDY